MFMTNGYAAKFRTFVAFLIILSATFGTSAQTKKSKHRTEIISANLVFDFIMKRIYRMIFAFLIFTVLGVMTTVFAQTVNSAVCADLSKDSLESKDIVVTICSHESGMAPLIQPRLYLRLFKDGRMQFETDNNSGSLSLLEMNVNTQDVEAIAKLVRQPDFLTSNAEYPIFQIWTDSSLKLTISVKSQEKQIIVNNFTDSDQDNKKHYPPSLLALLEKISELNVRKWDEISKFRAKNPPTEKIEPQIVDYEGTLEEGKIYRAIVYSNKQQTLSLAVPLKIPLHHADRIEWVNQAKFFFLAENRIVFRVKLKDTKQMTPNRWNTTYSCEILNLEESRTDRTKVKSRRKRK